MENSESINGIFTLEDLSPAWGAKFLKVTFDLPGEKVNKLDPRVMEAMPKLIEALKKKAKAIDAVLLVSGKPGAFIAGADIKMIEACKTAQEAKALSAGGHLLANEWEDLPFPTVAAVDGAALGGGCELCLASTAIVMSNDPAAKIGLPEVMLGVIPGMGGCIRLPQKVGIATAFDLILSSKQLNGERALKTGLIEAVVPKENFEQNVLVWMKSNLEALKKGKRLAKEPKLGGMGGVFGTLMENNPVGRRVIFKKAREGVLARTRGKYPATLETISVIEKSGVVYGPKARGSRRKEMLAYEAEGFGKMAATEVSKNLIRIFFMTEDLKKANGLAPGVSVETPEVTASAVLGAGVMGGGIAHLFASKDISIRMKDINVKGLEMGVQAASKLFAKDVKKKKIKPRQFVQKLNRIAPVLDYSGFRSVDLVIEAVVENMEIKKSVFKELENHIRPDCVVASNTSSLSVTEMQKAFTKPERFVGMHFFNPVHRMPLIEVIRGEKSSDEAVAAVFQISKRLGKYPIVVKDGAGFLVNRLLMPYLNEATFLVADGAPIPELDEAMLEFGMPMGPMELIDEVGVDVGDKVAHILHKAFGERMTPAPLNAKVVASGRLGKKTSKGLYVYEGSGDRKKKVFNEEIYGILGVKPKTGAISDEEMVDRCTLPMINEASRCLEEGIVSNATEVDLGMIMGTGFPPFRGGLLRYADSVGLSEIVKRLQKYEKRFGARFAPAEALINRVRDGKRFYS